MKKEALKLIATLTLTGTFALLSAMATAHAQSSDRITANIPFEFVVGDKRLPAGKYSVGSISPGGTAIVVQSADGRESALALTHGVQAGRSQTQARLVFHRYGNRYFLAQAWAGGDNNGREMIKSHSERALQRELARSTSQSEMAKNTSRPEMVTVIASLQ